MRLLIDREILQRIEATPSIVDNLTVPSDWGGINSPVQPASLDLHVGQIFVPGTPKNDLGGEDYPREEFSLGPGETLFVVSKELLRLPDDLTAIGFPPARVSSRGILMTNPGHVDPGFAGTLRFTLINMGREPFGIRTGDPIVTLLLFCLDEPPQYPYALRLLKRARRRTAYEELRHLSSDFLNFQERATAIARKEVDAAELGVKRLPFITAIAAAVITGVFTYCTSSMYPAWREPLSATNEKLSGIAAQLDVTRLTLRIDSLENAVRYRDSVPPMPAVSP